MKLKVGDKVEFIKTFGLGKKGERGYVVVVYGRSEDLISVEIQLDNNSCRIILPIENVDQFIKLI